MKQFDNAFAPFASAPRALQSSRFRDDGFDRRIFADGFVVFQKDEFILARFGLSGDEILPLVEKFRLHAVADGFERIIRAAPRSTASP